MTSDDMLTDLVDRAASELAANGFPAMPARVIMALTVSEEGRLTAEELAEQLAASPASISGAVRYLGTVGFLRQTTVPGSRRHLYSLPLTPWYTASLTKPGLYRNVAELLASSSSQLPDDSAARARLEEMADFFIFVERRLPMLLEEWHQERVSANAGERLEPPPATQ
ncbi:MAG: hypothetical protein JWN06_3689 [Propionibacteriaceae bacterium]|jgi:DNA-binding transcriptional regulator GbsR (MarR family)|nr:hypothetical protein [Propionibacteriaceae bacterium]